MFHAEAKDFCDELATQEKNVTNAGYFAVGVGVGDVHLGQTPAEGVGAGAAVEGAGVSEESFEGDEVGFDFGGTGGHNIGAGKRLAVRVAVESEAVDEPRVIDAQAGASRRPPQRASKCGFCSQAAS